MFEPENDIERALTKAATEPAARPEFLRALMDAEILMAFTVVSGALEYGKDGGVTIPEGTQLALATAVRGDEELIAFFTAPSRARAWFPGEHIVAPQTTRELFTAHRDASFVLNPGADYGKEFTPAEVERLLAGDFTDGRQSIVVEKETPVLLGHPKESPHALIAALARELGAVAAVRGAWLMLGMISGTDMNRQSWMLGVDFTGDWAAIQAAIDRATADGALGQDVLNAVQLDESSLSSTLRTGIPIVSPKPGLIKKLFG